MVVGVFGHHCLSWSQFFCWRFSYYTLVFIKHKYHISHSIFHILLLINVYWCCSIYIAWFLLTDIFVSVPIALYCIFCWNILVSVHNTPLMLFVSVHFTVYCQVNWHVLVSVHITLYCQVHRQLLVSVHITLYCLVMSIKGYRYHSAPCHTILPGS